MRVRLAANASLFREGMTSAGFTLTGAGHPIVPVMLGDAKLATEMSSRLLAEGLYVIGFSFPVVPQGQARIRTQMSAAHTTADIEFAVAVFTKVGATWGWFHEGAGQIEGRTRPVDGGCRDPRPSDRDVLIRVRKTSVCGTDLHIFKWNQWAAETIRVPMVIGHEFMGRSSVSAPMRGDSRSASVSGEGHITCGHCRNCRAGRRHFCHNHLGLGVTRPGAFAEYVVLPGENVFPVPDHISDDVASVLDPLGNAAHTALEFDMVGEDVLITGAGPIGIMATAIARHIGARKIAVTDVNPYRLKLAAGMGADRVIDARTETPRRDARAGDDGRLRCRPGDVRP